MSIPLILALVALILALVDEFRAQGESLTGWGVVFLSLAFMWGRIG